MCPPFHVWPPGGCIYPIQYLKNVAPLLVFGPSFWFLAPLLLNTGDGPVYIPESNVEKELHHAEFFVYELLFESIYSVSVKKLLNFGMVPTHLGLNNFHTPTMVTKI